MCTWLPIGREARINFAAHLLSGFALFFLLLLYLSSPASADQMFYYEDEDGVTHITDMPDSEDYSPFLVYGDEAYTREHLEWLVRKYGSRYGVNSPY